MSIHKDKQRGTYYVRYRAYDPAGRTINKCKRGFATKKEARQFEESVSRTSITCRKLLDEYIATHQLRHTSILNYRKAIDTFPYADMDINLITKPMLVKWYASNQDLSVATRNQRLTCIKIVFRYANRIYDIPDVSSVLRPYKEENIEDDVLTIWNTEHLDMVLRTLPEKYSLLVYLLFYTGMRVGEALALKPEDIHGNYISISRSRNRYDQVTRPKTKSSIRKIYVTDEVIKAIQPAIEQAYPFLFGYSYNAFVVAFKKAVSGLPVPQITAHGLRHSHASMLISAGAPIVAVSQRLGHANITTTLNTYTHLFQDDERKLEDILKATEKTP